MRQTLTGEMKEMKTRILTIFMVLAFCMSKLTFAQIPDAQTSENTLKTSVDLGVLIFTSDSTLNVYGEEKIEDNRNRAEHSASTWALPLVDLRYVLSGTMTQFFLGTPIEGSDIALALGVVQPLPEIGIITVSVAPTLGAEVWENPYETGVARSKSPVDVFTSKFKVDRLAFTPLNLEYTNRTIDVKNDEIGELEPDLKQDGRTDTLQITYDFGLSETSLLSPGISFEQGNFEGEANSYDQKMFSLSYKSLNGDLVFMVEGKAGSALFGKEHPLYEKTRRDDSAGAFALLRIQNLFDVENLHSNIILGGGVVNSNIDFFDNNTYFTALTLGYEY